MKSYKQCDLEDCSRDYLEALEQRLGERKARGETINEAFLEDIRRAIPMAPSYFVRHEI